jgi:hypothetical protein
MITRQSQKNLKNLLDLTEDLQNSPGLSTNRGSSSKMTDSSDNVVVSQGVDIVEPSRN